MDKIQSEIFKLSNRGGDPVTTGTGVTLMPIANLHSCAAFELPRRALARIASSSYFLTRTHDRTIA